jgi:hypothetical protein
LIHNARLPAKAGAQNNRFVGIILSQNNAWGQQQVSAPEPPVTQLHVDAQKGKEWCDTHVPGDPYPDQFMRQARGADACVATRQARWEQRMQTGIYPAYRGDIPAIRE